MSLPRSSLAAVTTAPGEVEVRELPMPAIGADGGWLQIEVAGVCIADVEAYPKALPPRVMGHENVGIVAAVGSTAAQRWGVTEGDRVVLEEYLPCGHCARCRSSEFRLCLAGDPNATPGALRYGATPLSVAPSLWGGQAQYLYLHPNSVFHRLDERADAVQASMALQLGNGFQWVCEEAGAGPGKVVVILGLAEKGLGCVLAAVAAGSDRVVAVGLGNDAEGLRVARLLGADAALSVGDGMDVVERILAEAGGPADIVVDTAGSALAGPGDLIDLLERCGTLVVATPPAQALSSADLFKVTKKHIVVRGVRGHSYHAVEWAIATIEAGRYPLAEMCSVTCGLDDVDRALRAPGDGSTIHAAIVPRLGAEAATP